MKWIIENWFKVSVLILMLFIIGALNNIASEVARGYDIANSDAISTRSTIQDAGTDIGIEISELEGYLDNINRSVKLGW